MAEFETQVEPEHYQWSPYHSPARWASFWHQIDEVVRADASTCLEVGVGGGVVESALRALGVAVTSVDIEPALGVGLVGDVRALPCEDDSFDVAVCCQVLEHIPWRDVPQALAELRRVARRRVIVSLPQSGRPLGLVAQLPSGKRVGFSTTLSARRKLRPGGEHYWQVSAPGTSRRTVRRAFGHAGLRLMDEYVVLHNTYHRFYILDAAAPPGTAG